MTFMVPKSFSNKLSVVPTPVQHNRFNGTANIYQIRTFLFDIDSNIFVLSLSHINLTILDLSKSRIGDRGIDDLAPHSVSPLMCLR